jgi:hypothetical protein
MSRLPLAVCLAVLVALLAVSPAGACMNDRETTRTESEFRKHYEFKSGFQPKATDEPPTTDKRWAPLIASFSGVGLLLGSFALIGINVRRQRRS